VFIFGKKYDVDDDDSAMFPKGTALAYIWNIKNRQMTDDTSIWYGFSARAKVAGFDALKKKLLNSSGSS